MDLLRGKITKSSDRSGKPRLFSAEGRIDESLEDRELIQSSGFASVPKEGDEVLVLSFGNLRIAVATDSKDRPSLEVGETAVFSSADTYIKLKADGTIEIVSKGNKIYFEGDIEASGEITAHSKTLPVKLSTHLHPTPVGPSSAPTPGT